MRVVALVDPRSPRGRHLMAEQIDGVELELLDWRDVLAVEGRLHELSVCRSPGVLRIDSPDKQPDVMEALLRRGGFTEPFVDEPGRWRAPGMLYRGIAATLRTMETSLRELPLEPWVSPAAILATFDKEETRYRLTQAGLPTCPAFSPASARGFDGEFERRGWYRAYLKLRFGWSGMGIVYLEGPQGVSTVVREGDALYNSRRLTWQPRDDLQAAVRAVIAEGATCEEAYDLAVIDDDPFDVRVVVIDGEVPFAVFRASRIPITNLHLVGRRADPERCLRAIGRRRWADALDVARRAAAVMDCPVAGVDLAFHRRRDEFTVLEVNALGDFLPRLTDAAGRTVHGAVLEAIARRG